MSVVAAPRGWATLRLPRRSIRLRLTVLYGVLFLVSGAGVLAITYLLMAHQFMQGGSFSIGGSDVPPDLSVPGLGGLPGFDDLAAQAARQRHQLLVQSGISLGIMTVASIGLGWVMAGRVLRPLRTITAVARNISAHQLDRRLMLGGPDDELKELGDTFDGLLGRLQAAFDAQRQFAANASHELRTPLTRARTLVEVALADPEPTVAGLRQTCERVLVVAGQQERLIEALLTLARSERGIEAPELVDLAAIIRETLLAFGGQADACGVRVEATLDDAAVWGDSRLVERLVTNVVDNALRYNVPDGRVTVTTSTVDRCGVLVIANTGPVIAAHEVARLTRPFQRLTHQRTASRDGHGLGLAIVHAIAGTHGARFTAVPQPAGGLRLEIVFPPVVPSTVAASGAPAASSPSR